MGEDDAGSNRDLFRSVGEFYAEPGMAWYLRAVGPHLHPGSEDATVALAARAEAFGFPGEGRILELASALGAPARYLARRFGATIVCIDSDLRMHRAALDGHRREGLWLRIHPLLARTERLPLADATCDAAWSQDAICHMDTAPVLKEAARVLKPGAIFAFSDFIARVELSAAERGMLRLQWAFPGLLRLGQYAALLEESGFDLLLAEDRTPGFLGRPSLRAADQASWEAIQTARFGAEEFERQAMRLGGWAALMEAGRTGYATFIARRRSPKA